MFVIKSILNDNRETSIIEAPTGSGKSLISIISAGVLSKYYHKSSYILCSDLFLWQQYADFIQEKNLSNFGYIKGAIGNYTCFTNKQDLSCGRCRLAKVSYRQLKDKGWRDRNFFSCVERCVYMQQRFKAEKSNVTLMTYQLFLHHMNLVNNKEGVEQSFPKRDVIFCDECHNIPDLVQQFCAPLLKDQRDGRKILAILDYAAENDIIVKGENIVDDSLKNASFLFNEEQNNIKDIHYTDVFDNTHIKERLDIIFNGLSLYNNNQKKILELLTLLYQVLTVCEVVNISTEASIKQESLFNTKNMDKSIMTLSKNLSWFKTYANSVGAFITAIKNSGREYLLMEITTDNDTKERSYQLNCAKEDYLCNEYLLKHANNKVLLSATVGSHSSFDENIGIKYTRDKKSYLSKIPSTFNFDKSPIYYIPTYKMSYNEKEVNFPKIQQLCLKIMAANKGVRGMIHTGSYENARMFYNSVPAEYRNRLYLYGNPKQKEEVLPSFKYSQNGILIGPTLTEGIDLPNDYCRFIILMKVPYPNIKGKLVKKKIELFPTWYNNTTSNIIIQSIGRGVRNEHDYCTTYILDGCFGNLYQKTMEQYPKHIQDRIKIITP